MGIMSRFGTCERLQLHSHMSSSRPVCKDHSEPELALPWRQNLFNASKNVFLCVCFFCFCFPPPTVMLLNSTSDVTEKRAGWFHLF